MRILAIRGQNLASLAAPFEVRLDEGPLGGAGLFAVVGETGAGKSTLLDAACLALYGKCPRVVAEGGRDELPDATDTKIASNDPRTVLRRGAASGFAEVDFVGGDGERYRATWSVRRARDRSDGRLQNAQWSLVRLVDGRGVADGIEQTRAAVEQIVGLTFDQFRRTVLLAQGDFDAFLRADDRDRADLLEKVTGAEIYARISRRVFEAAREKRDAAERLRQRLDDVGGLDAEARAALESELSEAGAALGRIRTEREGAQAQLDLARRRDGADRALEHATQATDAAETAWSGAAPERERLARLDAAERVRPALMEEAEARADLARSQTAAEEARYARVTAQAEAADREGQAKAAAERLEAAEAEFKAFGPVWTEAEHLDGRLAAAEAARTKADQALAETSAGLNTAEQALTTAQAGAGRLRAALASAEAARAEGPDLAALALREDEIKAEFDVWAKALAEAEGAGRTRMDHSADLDTSVPGAYAGRGHPGGPGRRGESGGDRVAPGRRRRRGCRRHGPGVLVGPPWSNWRARSTTPPVRACAAMRRRDARPARRRRRQRRARPPTRPTRACSSWTLSAPRPRRSCAPRPDSGCSRMRARGKPPSSFDIVWRRTNPVPSAVRGTIRSRRTPPPWAASPRRSATRWTVLPRPRRRSRPP